MCPPMWAHWRIRLNLSFLRPTPIHNPNDKSIGSAVFAPLTADCRQYVHWRHLANTIEIVHIGVIWRIRLNFCFLRPTRADNWNDKSIGWAIFAQLKAKVPIGLLYNRPVWLPPKLPLLTGGSGSASNTWLLGTIQARNPNGISIGSAVFAQMTAKCPYTLPLKIAPSHGGIWTPSNTRFPGPTKVLNRNCILIGSAVCAVFTNVTDQSLFYHSFQNILRK